MINEWVGEPISSHMLNWTHIEMSADIISQWPLPGHSTTCFIQLTILEEAN